MGPGMYWVIMGPGIYWDILGPGLFCVIILVMSYIGARVMLGNIVSYCVLMGPMKLTNLLDRLI